jgi:TonB family protein
VVHLAVFAAVLALTPQQPAPSPSTAEPSPCVAALSTVADVAVGQLCAGEASLRQADAAAEGTQERQRALDAAVSALRRAVNLSTATDTTVRALNLLATAYDADHLNAGSDLEQVLRDLIAATPDDLTPMYRLSTLQEDRELIDAAEATLLDARHRQPENEEPNRRLAQFYARRVTALHKRNAQTPPETVSNPGEPDATGVYRIGDSLQPPARSDVPHYPADALAAGIRGSVLAEIVVDTSGNVSDARVVRSIPLLDDAALQAVRNWHFTPTVVNGQPVPVRMTVTVNFAPPAPAPASRPPQAPAPTRTPGL